MSTSKGFICEPCNVDCKNKSGLTKHRQSQAHRKVVAAAKAEKSDAADDVKGKGQQQDEGSSTDTYCEVCRVECKTAKALGTHNKTRSHGIRAAEKKDGNKEEKQEESFFCKLCNIDCFTKDGFAMHKQTRVHCIALANSQDADKDEEPDDMETEASGGSGQEKNTPQETYCDVCNIECKTPKALFAHTKSMTHILKASESGTMETVDDRGDTFCNICHVECDTANNFAAHKESMGHLIRARKQDKKSVAVETPRQRREREEKERREEMEKKVSQEIDGFFCTLCNVDCFNDEGVALHCQSRIHYLNRANAETKEEEEEEEDMEDDEPEETYCSVCRVECRTPGGLFAHTKSVSHMMRASESGTMETVREEENVEMEDDEDKGPLYCRACRHLCENEEDFSNHTQTIGHHMKQRKYDQQQRNKYGDSRGPEHLGGPPDHWGRGPSGRWAGGPPEYDRQQSFGGGRSSYPMETQQYEEPEEPKTHPDYPELLLDAIEDGISICSFCNARMRTYDYPDHKQAPRHRRRVRAINAGGAIYAHTAGLATRQIRGPAEIQQEIEEKDTNWFVGLEYIYEIHRRTTIGKPYYLCTLCDVGHIEVTSHATCKDHRLLYFKKHSEELEDIVWPFIPRPGTEFHGWYKARYTREALETEAGFAPKRPKPSQETTMLIRMAREVCRKRGVQLVNKHEEIRGKLVRPEKDQYPNVRPLEKWNAKRLFIGNLPYGVDEMELLDFLNRQTINRAIIDLDMGKDKKFAFAAFRTYDDASQFLVFDGIVFKNTELRVTRPQNYRPLPGQDDMKVLRECTIPRPALLYNKVLPYPPGSKHTNSLHIKGLLSRIDGQIILDFINNLVLGTPATGINEITLKREQNWACFVTFRSTEETTDVLEAALGEMFQFKPLNISRPTNYVSPEEAMAQQELNKPIPQMPPGGKRPIDAVPPLYTNFQKISRTEPVPHHGPQDGFRGGWLGFVKPGDRRPQHQHSGQYGMEGQGQPQGPDWGRNQGQGRHIQGQRQMQHGQKQGQSDYQGQRQGQSYGQHQEQGYEQFQGQGQNRGQSQFQGQRPNQYQGQGQNQAQGRFQGQGPNQYQGQGQNKAQGRFQGQGRNQYESQGQNQAQGQFQGQGPNQYQGQGQNQAHVRFQGQGPNQYQDQGQNQGQDQFQGQGQNQYQDPAQNQGRQFQDQSQNQNQYQSQVSGPPMPSQGIKGTATYVGEPGPRRGQPPPPPSANYPPPPTSGPSQYGTPEYSISQPPPPTLPPPPKETQLTTMLKESKETLTNDTICTDEEALMAQQVAMQLTGGLNVYNSIKNIKQKHMPYATTLQAPQDQDLEEWLKYMSHFLDKGRIVNEEEATLAQEVINILTEEVKKYQDRCMLTTTNTTQAATSSTDTTAAVQQVPTYSYQNYTGYGQYGQYAQYATAANMQGYY